MISLIRSNGPIVVCYFFFETEKHNFTNEINTQTLYSNKKLNLNVGFPQKIKTNSPCGEIQR